MLAGARENYSDAMNVLMLVQMHSLPATIEDVMYAYMVARDWCKWIKNPNTPRNPLFGQTADFSPVLDIFRRFVASFERELEEQKTEVDCVFEKLNPNLVYLTQRREIEISETTKMYCLSLRYTAQFFADTCGDGSLNEILDKKNVPPLD